MNESDVVELLGPRRHDGASEITGFGRNAWVRLLANLTASFAEAADSTGSPARAWLPGADEPRLIEGLEGFARMSVAWGAWLGQPVNPTVLSARGREVDVLELVVRGFDDGTNKLGHFWWGEFSDKNQRIVEAAELATSLWLGRDRLVPALGAERLQRLLGWLDGIHGRAIYSDNWYLFPVMVALTQRALGWPVKDKQIDRGIDWMVEKYRGDGWYADGPGNAFDLYTGWAIHWHLMFWARIDGHRRPRLARLVEGRFRSFLRSYVALVAPDGSRPLFGRSLGYRFAFAAPLALGALLNVDALPPGLARRAATSVIAHDVQAGAIDPQTGWLLRGVAGERPDVCERYMSRGAAAWAAHALVALGLPPEAPFWSDAEQRLPSETSDGEECLRAAGFIVEWRASTGETEMRSGRADHPSDIPGHDYAPYYGKFAYRSAFPLSVRSAAAQPTPDGGILFSFTRARDTRRRIDAGGAGPGWTWSEYRVGPRSRCTASTTVVSLGQGVEVRVSAVDPATPVALSEGPAALGVDHATDVVRGIDPGPTSWASAGERYVAIRALVGYDDVVASAPVVPGDSDRNLVFDHAEQPIARESRASAGSRVVAAIGCAVSAGRPSLTEVTVAHAESDVTSGKVVLNVRDREQIVVCVGRERPDTLIAANHVFTGHSLRVVRAATDGSSFAGEPITHIRGVLRLAQSGPVLVRRRVVDGRPTVEVVTMSGIELDHEWTRSDLAHLERRDVDGWHEIGPLDEPNVIPDDLVQQLQKAHEQTLVHLRLT